MKEKDKQILSCIRVFSSVSSPNLLGGFENLILLGSFSSCLPNFQWLNLPIEFWIVIFPNIENPLGLVLPSHHFFVRKGYQVFYMVTELRCFK